MEVMSFTERYRGLNAAQKQAVDAIEGPVMVVAGPGTGKTELLGMRAANILRQTDTLPANILCLTFTDSGAAAMRERLASIIGADAYKVAIHTFHSFGSEIINQYSEFFYSGASFRPADELSRHELIETILDELDYSNPLAGKMNGSYTHLRDVITTISDLKRSGLTSDELLQILDEADATLDSVERDIAGVFSTRISSSTLARLLPVAHAAAALATPSLPGGVTPLANVIALSLAHAIDAATDTDSTKPITAWKQTWLTKDATGAFVFKDRARIAKLRSLSFVYFQYLARMQEAELYDYDDMILRVAHALEVFDELRFNLQERYQYIMVDEFQDTNLAQMRILASLTNNPAQGDTPNILVVGDDDQAIYSFQGADISNIFSFQTTYPHHQLITLTDNYRSGQTVLDAARGIITQAGERLERHIPDLDKTLNSQRQDGPGAVTLHEAATLADERQWLAETIAEQIRQGTAPGEITVLARRHHEIVELLPFFVGAGIPVNYERRDNVLELEPIRLLEQMARVIGLVADHEHDEAAGLLPELLAHPMWGIATSDLWKLSLKAYDSRRRWLEEMETTPAFQPLWGWLLETARRLHDEPLETMIDRLVGVDQLPDEGYTSPFYEYFFSAEALAAQPDLYLRYLEGLRTIRAALRDYQPTEPLTLHSFVSFVELYRETGATLTSVHQPASSRDGAINLMTAHKSKGLEFDHVYIVGAIDSAWGERVRTRSRLIGYPENLPLAAAGDSSDERLRLFFVAATRARRTLSISYSLMSDEGKAQERASFLLSLDAETIPAHVGLEAETRQAERRWHTRLVEPVSDLRTLLAPSLERYKLSATHLGNFLDVTRGGPQAFLVGNLLRFPQAMSPAAAYGSAIHTALQRAHAHLAATGKQRAIEDVLYDYDAALSLYYLAPADRELYSQKGADALQAFLASHYDHFTPTQKVELNFAGQLVRLGEAHLTGKLDLVDLDSTARTMVVTDYKTGHPASRWQGSGDYEKLKLHRYRQQLMFYKLLVEHSRDYADYTVTRGVLQFVEPTKSGDIVALEDDFSASELEEFQALIAAVWQRIVSLELPDTSGYEPSYKGVLAFERDLLDNNL